MDKGLSVALDLLAALFLLVSYLLSWQKDKNGDPLYANVRGIVLGVLAMLTLDAVYSFCVSAAAPVFARVAFYIKSVYIVSKSVVLFIGADYVGRIIVTDKSFYKKYRPVFGLYMAVNALLVLINLFTPVAFFIDRVFVFRVNPGGMFVLVLMNYASVFTLLALMIKKRHIKLRALNILMLFQLPVIFTELFSFVGTGISMTCAYALSCILLLNFYKDYHSFTDIEHIIDRALSEHGFQVFYQPVYSVREKRFNMCEALLRLYDSEHGFISPQVVISHAEKSDRIIAIGDYVLNEVLSFMSSELFASLGIKYISVNFSMLQMTEQGLADRIAAMLDKYGVEPSRLCAEITETTASSLESDVLNNMSMMAHNGIRFALDDYGTGYSNLYRMAMMPLNVIKLDRFVVQRLDDPRVKILMEATIEMCRRLGLETVVEGVECEEEYDLFAAAGADHIQGFYFSKALSKEDLADFIAES